VRRQAKIATYRRVRFLESPKTGTKLYMQYDRAHGWLKPVRLTAVANVDLLPYKAAALDREEFLLLCTVRAWAVSALPVSRVATTDREIWARVDRVLPHASNFFMIVVPLIAALAAIVMWVIR
jgi:hypothetical protein